MSYKRETQSPYHSARLSAIQSIGAFSRYSHKAKQITDLYIMSYKWQISVNAVLEKKVTLCDKVNLRSHGSVNRNSVGMAT